MSKKRKSKQKIIGSILGVIILAIAGIFGLNQENINELFGTVNNNIANEQRTEVNSLPVEGNLQVYFIDVGQADSILITNNNANINMIVKTYNKYKGDIRFWLRE